MGYAGSGSNAGSGGFVVLSNASYEVTPQLEVAALAGSSARTRCLNAQGQPHLRATLNRLPGDAGRDLTVQFFRRAGVRNDEAGSFLAIAPANTMLAATTIVTYEVTGVSAADVMVRVTDAAGGVGTSLVRVQLEATAS